ncbi:phytanoyl-CoA dioxygenase family protein [Luteipulveratus mongoliensis]|uniref:Phytanoyl-CoA dioxygenase n=1 Tax=Luteipulveratus mongoliensis TaxID=571913 RepID=A0A0K1JPX8_9MICO|nr:phytanoyl-CoA dioxygenase family protein [Luteipulveratus mongoliensis]AKU18764.1 phytanoyl-CoA dioxygenase [Luteipulveratus mongoliensis]
MLSSNGYVLDESDSRLGRLEPVPRRELGDRALLWERLRRDGYLYLRKALDPAYVMAFRRHYFETLAESGLVNAGTDPADGISGAGDLDRARFRELLFGRIVPGREYADFCTQPALRDWFAWLFEADPFLHRRKIIRHGRPGEAGIGTATQAHYDLVYLREGTDRLLSAWIPLGDCPLARGGLTYLEGSHHVVRRHEASERRQHPAASITADLPALAEQHDARWLVADYEAGDVVVHSPHIVHASLDNTDPDGVMRLSTDIRYQRRDDPIDWRWGQDWHIDDGL